MSQAEEMEFHGSDLLCASAVGQQHGAETRPCLTGLLSPDRMWQLPSCRSQDRFRLCDMGYEGELLCGKVT